MVRSVMFANRYELKYIIQTKNISTLLDSFGQILTPDKNNKNNLGYYNHSIYFDTHKLRFYRDKQEGLLQRLKPRIRLYRSVNDFDIKSLFLEFKHKNDRTVFNNRVEINAQTAMGVCLAVSNHTLTRLRAKTKQQNFFKLSKNIFANPK